MKKSIPMMKLVTIGNFIKFLILLQVRRETLVKSLKRQDNGLPASKGYRFAFAFDFNTKLDTDTRQ